MAAAPRPPPTAMPKMAIRTSWLLACALLPAASMRSALAQDITPRPADRAGTFAFILENDTFGGTDKYYTNGFLFAWRSSPTIRRPG
ncbi:lipid A-modifier LpxR family protein [Dankookia sp. P2]|uniref:lipid A-modifier LpxR family protein n=1 Tax=Dankookia sp. P2 TaxID=3423955 RepID=UPI003D66E54D